MTTCDEFNKKWNKYLKDGCYGIEIENIQVISYLDNEFKIETAINPSFNFSQIKIKVGTTRIYAYSSKTETWEKVIHKRLKDT